MKTEIADKKLEILNWIFKSKDGASWNEVSEMLNEFERICKDETPVIKAKALRKKGTDKWYDCIECESFDFDNDIIIATGWGFPNGTLLSSALTFCNTAYPLPPDSELVDLEIRIIEK